jgi:4a-hydroxytetrahydrobiopterin dehydratase
MSQAQLLSGPEVAVRLAGVPQWRAVGASIMRIFEFTDFPAAMRFVNRVADAAERAWHHPDMDIRWNKVALTLTTHDSGGLTAKDFDLAAEFDRIAAETPSN